LSEVHYYKILQIWKGGWIKGTQKKAEFLGALARAIENNDPAVTTLESYIDKVEYFGQCPGQIIYSRPANYQNDSLICQAHDATGIYVYKYALADNNWEGGYTFEQVVPIIEELLSRCDLTKQEIYPDYAFISQNQQRFPKIAAIMDVGQDEALVEPPEGFTISRSNGRVQGRAKVCTICGEMLFRPYYFAYDNRSSVWNNPVLERDMSHQKMNFRKTRQEKN
jgi:hypothetical protein